MIDIDLDWQAYFRAFNESHGGNPVRVGGKFLYRDGWRYSATDHAGPEYPPPADAGELRALVESYWWERCRVLREEVYLGRMRYEALDAFQRAKSMPLIQAVVSWSDEDKRYVVANAAVDFALLRTQLEMLERDLVEAEKVLKEITHGRR